MRFAPVTTLARSIANIDLNKATEAALQARGDDISELNREQLRRGQDVSGASLPPYSARSVDVFGKPAGAIKLFDTGDYYGAMKPEFSDKSFMVTNTDWKAEMLTREYGDVIGLQKESINELAQDALGQIQYELRKQI
jgi:hypothetical protein